MGAFGAITKWLHTMYPMGMVERLPVVNEDGSTSVPGVYIVGDLSGIPLLKFSQHTGARVVETLSNNPRFRKSESDDTYDVVILGAGVSGISAAMECERKKLKYVILEASEPFSTIVNFPREKPIYLYPTEMEPAGSLKVTAGVKEPLLDELRHQANEAGLNIRKGVRATHIERKGDTLHAIVPKGDDVRAKAVIVAIGRSGNFRKMGVPGEEKNKVYNRLHDPADYKDQKVLVVGGGDSAAEASIALAQKGAEVTLAYRGAELTRPKPENVEKVQALAVDEPAFGRIRLLLNTQPKEIGDAQVVLASKDAGDLTIENAHVFSLIGREAPLDFFRKTGIPIHGEWNPKRILTFSAFLVFCVWLYNWKGGGYFGELFALKGWFPFNVPDVLASFGSGGPGTLMGTLKISMASPSFYYTLAYCLCVGIFGIRRIRRRKTPYVMVQTLVLFLVQTIPLFLLPEIILPLLGHNGVFDTGLGQTIANNLFPEAGYGHGREYWRAVGFILAWPLFLYNFFTAEPMMWWLVIGSIQTFVIIPGLIYFYGKGAYCGWICSCGALAETMGDAHRTKMPHGPFWSKLNMAGQVILWVAVALMVLRVVGWIAPESFAGKWFDLLLSGKHYAADGSVISNPINYKWIVDVSLAGVIGVGFYFWFSGRVWCRFFCPLAALMHFYAKFSRFRILPEKKKCISCNVCTSVCHQGIDIMNFANKGIPMEDPECVRCSACVQMCPTGVLQFGQVDKGGEVIKYDSLPASPVLMAEKQK